MMRARAEGIGILLLYALPSHTTLFLLYHPRDDHVGASEFVADRLEKAPPQDPHMRRIIEWYLSRYAKKLLSPSGKCSVCIWLAVKTLSLRLRKPPPVLVTGRMCIFNRNYRTGSWAATNACYITRVSCNNRCRSRCRGLSLPHNQRTS